MGIDYKLLRETAKQSVESFAAALEVTPELVRAWEDGSAKPDAIQQKRIFAVFKKIAEEGQ